MIAVVVTTGVWSYKSHKALVKSSPPTPSFSQAGCPSCCPINSVEARQQHSIFVRDCIIHSLANSARHYHLLSFLRCWWNASWNPSIEATHPPVIVSNCQPDISNIYRTFDDRKVVLLLLMRLCVHSNSKLWTDLNQTFKIDIGLYWRNWPILKTSFEYYATHV